ncbi:MAG: hypothetical protein HY919_05850 [Elusimicrobia bacterium]|nr:hypothetical protein [Elusimicrobiota bacterium]
MNNSDDDIVSLDVLDADPVLEIVPKNIFGLKKRFLFFDTHFEYKDFFGRKRKVYYSLIEKIYLVKNKIKIKLYSKMFTIMLRGVKNPEENYEKLKKLTGF